MNTAYTQTGAVAYKCPSCNAPLSFNIETQDFTCEFCGGHYNKAQLDKMQSKSLEAAPAFDNDQKNFTNDNNLYVCPTCGAEVMTDSELSASAICHYCHSPIVLSGRLGGEFCPDMIIPFKITKERALEDFGSWTKKHKFFLAKGFTEQKSLETIKGVYVPYWLADCIVEGHISADCFQRIGSVRSGDYIINTENKFRVERHGSLRLDGIPADGSTKADDALMESIEPFDYSALENFKMSYLSGHYAEKYDVTKDQVYGRINQRAVEAAKTEFMGTIKNYTRKVVLNQNYQMRGIRWKYVMLPMWFLTYSYKGSNYYYAMNGQTGKYGGTLPINKLKLALFSFGIPIGIALLLSFLAMISG